MLFFNLFPFYFNKFRCSFLDLTSDNLQIYIPVLELYFHPYQVDIASSNIIWLQTIEHKNMLDFSPTDITMSQDTLKILFKIPQIKMYIVGVILKGNAF